MDRLTKKQIEAQKRKAQEFAEIHKDLFEGKKIEYTYTPKSEDESIRIFLGSDTGRSLVLSPDGSYTIE